MYALLVLCIGHQRRAIESLPVSRMLAPKPVVSQALVVRAGLYNLEKCCAAIQI
jgi:hypothetical protein